MHARQQLVEEWKAKLEASSQPPVENGERFAWVRQIYTRIYRFLLSCYGDGEWREADDASIANADPQSTASHMPFVENCSTTDGLAPKSPERIRAALESIHAGNPGVATPGKTEGVSDDTWVVVAALPFVKDAKSVRHCLAVSKIESRLKRRATDAAVLVRYRDFEAACALAKDAETIKVIRLRRQVNRVASVGCMLLISSSLTFIVAILVQGPSLASLNRTYLLLWFTGIVTGWLYLRRGRRH